MQYQKSCPSTLYQQLPKGDFSHEGLLYSLIATHMVQQLFLTIYLGNLQIVCIVGYNNHIEKLIRMQQKSHMRKYLHKYLIKNKNRSALSINTLKALNKTKQQSPGIFEMWFVVSFNTIIHYLKTVQVQTTQF